MGTDFHNKVAIITGAASGIGRGLAQALALRGAILVLTDIDEAGVREVARDIVQSGGKAEAAHLDVADHAAVERFVETTAAAHGRLDYMFNNAGVGMAGETRDTDFAHWKRIVDVNLLGVIAGATAAYRVMIRQRNGHIVNVASAAGYVGTPLATAYSTTKAAVIMFSDMLRLEGAALGVRVSAVCPGFVQTGIYEAATWLRVDGGKVMASLPLPMMNSAAAVAKILAGVERNKRTIIFPFYARLGWWMNRWVPWIGAPLHKMVLQRFRRMRKDA